MYLNQHWSEKCTHIEEDKGNKLDVINTHKFLCRKSGEKRTEMVSGELHVNWRRTVTSGSLDGSN